MTQEDKELSFIDISGRLHYGVIVNYKENEYDHREWKITNLHTLSYSKSGTLIDTDFDGWISYEEYKGCGMSTGSRPFRFGEVLPYLRPMSSMTEEENGELWFLLTEGRTNIKLNSNGQLTTRENIELGFNYPFVCPEGSTLYVDWLNAHHFDYRGLIEKGLAIETTEGMYK